MRGTFRLADRVAGVKPRPYRTASLSDGARLGDGTGRRGSGGHALRERRRLLLVGGVEPALLHLRVPGRPEGVGEHEPAGDEQHVGEAARERLRPRAASPRRPSVTPASGAGGVSTGAAGGTSSGVVMPPSYPSLSALTNVLDWRSPRRPPVRSCSDVHNCLAEEGVPHEIVQLPSRLQDSTATPPSCSASLPPRSSSPSCSFVDDEPWLVLVPGDSTVDKRSLRRGAGADQVVLGQGASKCSRRPATGSARCRPAVSPPTCRWSPTRVSSSPVVVYCGGGTTSTMLKIRSADLEALAAAPSRARRHPEPPAVIDPVDVDEGGDAEMTDMTHSIGSAGRLAVFARRGAPAARRGGARGAGRGRRGRPVGARARRLAAQGAAIDGARVRLPRELVRRLVDLAPAAMTLGARAAAAARHGRALADHHRRLLRRDLRPRERREAWHHRRRRGDHLACRRRACPRSTSAGRP